LSFLRSVLGRTSKSEIRIGWSGGWAGGSKDSIADRISRVSSCIEGRKGCKDRRIRKAMPEWQRVSSV
jgi:hypothetical protein